MKTPHTAEPGGGSSAAKLQDLASRRIRVGVGGWTYAPWRDNFFPKGLPQQEELGYASRQLTAIEVNGTYYRSFRPSAFASWRDQTPDDFLFALKLCWFPLIVSTVDSPVSSAK